MSILTQDALIDLTKNLMGGSTDRVTTDGYESAAGQVEKELGITYPITDDTLSYWSAERMRRHSLYILMVESAHKFQYKQIHLEHRFKHYIQLIEKMDNEWLEAMDDNPDLFGSVYSDFSFYLAPGFVYDCLGKDITYE
jgi:hypothetical protein